jgi:hypothetical protein
MKAAGILALCAGVGSTAFAAQWTPAAHFGIALSPNQKTQTVVSAPEIDPAGALSGLTLLLGGLAVVRGRRAK